MRSMGFDSHARNLFVGVVDEGGGIACRKEKDIALAAHVLANLDQGARLACIGCKTADVRELVLTS